MLASLGGFINFFYMIAVGCNYFFNRYQIVLNTFKNFNDNRFLIDAVSKYSNSPDINEKIIVKLNSNNFNADSQFIAFTNIPDKNIVNKLHNNELGRINCSSPNNDIKNDICVHDNKEIKHNSVGIVQLKSNKFNSDAKVMRK